MEKILKKIRKIEPRNEFRQESRAIILNSAQHEYHPGAMEYIENIFSLRTTLGVTVASVLLILSGLALLNDRLMAPSLVSNLDPDNLNEEVAEFNLRLSQIEYYEDAAKKVEVALRETSGELSREEREALIDDVLNKLAL